MKPIFRSRFCFLLLPVLAILAMQTRPLNAQDAPVHDARTNGRRILSRGQHGTTGAARDLCRQQTVKTARIEGEFTVVLLGDDWPAPLVRWFGPPAAAKDVQQPFSHSYDQ